MGRRGGRRYRKAAAPKPPTKRFLPGGVEGSGRAGSAAAPAAGGEDSATSDSGSGTDADDVTPGLAATPAPSGDAAPAKAETVAPKVLEPLDAGALSATYGLGYDMLKRMGFTGGGLKTEALQTPLRAHNQGTSRRGVQGAGEEAEADAAFSPGESPLARGAGAPLSKLVQDAVRAMREAGDDGDADELQRLALFALRPGSEELCGGASPPPASDSEESAPEAPVHPGTRERDQDALSAVLNGLLHSSSFPVEASEQATELGWRRRWKGRLGPYIVFAERHKESLRVVRCPAPAGALVLPALEPAPAGSVGGPWPGGSQYTAWCRAQRRAATGKAKRKWQHVEKLVARYCKGCLPQALRGPASAASGCSGEPDVLLPTAPTPLVSTNPAEVSSAAALAGDGEKWLPEDPTPVGKKRGIKTGGSAPKKQRSRAELQAAVQHCEQAAHAQQEQQHQRQQEQTGQIQPRSADPNDSEVEPLGWFEDTQPSAHAC